MSLSDVESTLLTLSIRNHTKDRDGDPYMLNM